MRGAVALVALGLALSTAAIAQKAIVVTKPAVYGTAQTSASVTDANVAGGKATRITVTQAGAKPWAAGSNSFVDARFKAGDRAEVTVWLRVATPDAATPPRAQIALLLANPPRTEFGKSVVTPTDVWAPYKFTATVPSDQAAYATMVGVQVGFAKQAIDLGPITVVNLGPAG